MTKHASFHWPDHTIGKAESRQIRETHNAAINALYRMDFLKDEQERELGRKLVEEFGLKRAPKELCSHIKEPCYMVGDSHFTALGVFRRFASIVAKIQHEGSF